MGPSDWEWSDKVGLVVTCCGVSHPALFPSDPGSIAEALDQWD